MNMMTIMNIIYKIMKLLFNLSRRLFNLVYRILTTNTLLRMYNLNIQLLNLSRRLFNQINIMHITNIPLTMYNLNTQLLNLFTRLFNQINITNITNSLLRMYNLNIQLFNFYIRLFNFWIIRLWRLGYLLCTWLLRYIGIINNYRWHYRPLSPSHIALAHGYTRRWARGRDNNIRRIIELPNMRTLRPYVVLNSTIFASYSLALILYADPDITSLYWQTINRAVDYIFHSCINFSDITQYIIDNLTNQWCEFVEILTGRPYFVPPFQVLFDGENNFPPHNVNYEILSYWLNDQLTRHLQPGNLHMVNITFPEIDLNNIPPMPWLEDYLAFSIDDMIPNDRAIRLRVLNYRLYVDDCAGILLPRDYLALRNLLDDPEFTIDMIVHRDRCTNHLSFSLHMDLLDRRVVYAIYGFVFTLFIAIMGIDPITYQHFPPMDG